MMDRTLIPTTMALLGLSFTACGKDEDTIVGTWDARNVDGVAFPYSYEYDGFSYTFAVRMILRDDLTGTYRSDLTSPTPGLDETYTFGVTIDDTAAPSYKIVINSMIPKLLTCMVDGSTMNCNNDVDGGKSTFLRTAD